MKEFIKGYLDIYNFTKEKIENELRVIVEYFYENSARFNVNNIDIIDEALTHQEQKERKESLKELEQQQHTKLVNQIIRNLLRKKLDNNLNFENYFLNTERELKEIMDKYKIKIN